MIKVAKLTCKQTSVVDYFIMSPEILPCLSNLKVLDFDPLISDIHNQIQAVTMTKKYDHIKVNLDTGNLPAPTNHHDQILNKITKINQGWLSIFVPVSFILASD